MTRHFMEMQVARWKQGNIICVGLDPVWEKIPSHLTSLGTTNALVEFAGRIVEATRHVAGTFKPNRAFWAALGAKGLDALRRVVKLAHEIAPTVPVILDAKIADIGKTNKAYVAEVFDDIGADAVTVHPYLGRTALLPFLEREHNGVIVLCRTSNDDAGEFQDLVVQQTDDEMAYMFRCAGVDNVPSPFRLFHKVGFNVAEKWNGKGNCALVCGATYPGELGQVRRLVGDLPFLIPGLGAQSKTKDMETDIRLVVEHGANSQAAGMIPNMSTEICYASSGLDFATAAGDKAEAANALFLKYCLKARDADLQNEVSTQTM